jgi:hypothetical protein
MFYKGSSIDQSTETFETLSKFAFKAWRVLNIPIVREALKVPTFRHFLEFAISHFTDGLYPPENIEAVLKQVFGEDKSILDFSYATAMGTLIGLPVGTVNGKPSRRIFTNYNGVGNREKNQGKLDPYI